MNVDGSPKLLSLLCTTVPTRLSQSRFPPSPYGLRTLLLVGDALDVEARAAVIVQVAALPANFRDRLDGGREGERRCCAGDAHSSSEGKGGY